MRSRRRDRPDFAGFLVFLDPPKAGAREALAALASLGVAVKVVTGDNEQVTRHVCGELGLAVEGTLTGPEIAGLTDEALAARLDHTTLFCRVTPPQKSRIIAALRRRAMSSAISATASTTRRRCTPPMSAFRSTPPWTSRRTRPP